MKQEPPKNSWPNNITTVVSDYLCHACGACSVVCRNGSIRFQETVGGYLFPKIDETSCDHCGMCYSVCAGARFGENLAAIMPQDPFVGEIISCQTGKATNEYIYQNAQSGGIATAFLSYLLETGQITAAIVARMRSGTPPRGDVLLATSAEDLLVAQKSKYVPIPLLTAIGNLDYAHAKIGIVGLSCQMHGLHNLLRFYPELQDALVIKIGLVCDRVMTNASIDFLGSVASAEPIRHIIFRDKLKPSYPGNPVIETASGKTLVLDAALRMKIKDCFTPVRCRLCFDKLNVLADVVLGDPHGIADIDQVRGESLIFGRTARGQSLLAAAASAGAITVRQADAHTAIKGQDIPGKRTQWAGYMQAQEALGGMVPGYPDVVWNNSVAPSNINEYKESILWSKRLDNFPTRDKLFVGVKRWLRRKRIRAIVLSIKKISYAAIGRLK